MIWSNSPNFNWKFDAPNHSEKLFQIFSSDWKNDMNYMNNMLEWADLAQIFRIPFLWYLVVFMKLRCVFSLQFLCWRELLILLSLVTYILLFPNSYLTRNMLQWHFICEIKFSYIPNLISISFFLYNNLRSVSLSVCLFVCLFSDSY